MMKLAGPLHPLPIPENCGDSVVIDFIGPLPEDDGYDCIVSMTDRLGSDIRISPTRMNITADEFAILFFDVWFCENGLPLNIMSDCNHLFISEFWWALHKLTGVKLKMSTSYHPQMDGSSKCSNKTLNQALRYHIQCNQKGWVQALPCVHFDMMNTFNTINKSTGFLGFPLRMGRSPCLLPPLVAQAPQLLEDKDIDALVAQQAIDVVDHLELDVLESKDNLLYANFFQSHQANKYCGPKLIYEPGDLVMLSTLHCHCEYKNKGDK
jgi:hypothetical protein